jgi:pimeloyl-ACP methyl ester carboxylesterase
MGTEFVVRSGGAGLQVVAAGGGPVVIMLHAGVADRRMWRGAMAALARRRRVAAYDRRGFGETRTPDEPFQHVGDLEAVIRQLGDPQPALVGCSQGGRVAIDHALERPDAVAALVLVSSAVGGAAIPDAYPAGIAAMLAALEEAETRGDLDAVNAIEARLWLDGPLAPEGRVGGAARALFLDMNGRALRHPPLTRERPCADALGRLGDIAVPVLVLSGGLDFPHVQERSRAIAAAVPGARAAAFANCAHLLPLEEPERFAATVEGFLHGLRG